MYPSFRESKKHHLFKSFGLKIIYFSIIFIGCFYQTYYICQFYYSYPTIVSTETQFFNDDNELPAITICAAFDEMSRGSTLNQTLNNIDFRKLIKSANITIFDFSYHQNVTELVLRIRIRIWMIFWNILMKERNWSIIIDQNQWKSLRNSKRIWAKNFCKQMESYSLLSRLKSQMKAILLRE